MGKRVATLLMGAMLILTLAGCQSKNSIYEGAGVKFKYDPLEWSVFYRETDSDDYIIELYSDKGGGLSIVSCQGDPDSVEEIYTEIISEDQLLGQVSGLSAQNNMTEENGTAAYAHRTATNFMNDYWTLFYGKNLGDGQIIMASATIYIEDEEDADQCKKEIEHIVASLRKSDELDLGEITKVKLESGAQTNVLVDYLSHADADDGYVNKSETAAVTVEPIQLDDFEYIDMVTLTDGITNQKIDAYVPAISEKPSVSNTGYYSDYGHGISFFLNIVGDWSYTSAEEEVAFLIQTEVSGINYNPSLYQNMVIDDCVMVEEGLCYYQHMSVEELDMQENASMCHTLIYVGTTPEGIGYSISLEVREKNTDSETNRILEEIGKCYNLDLSGYGNSEDDLNNAGKRADASQDIYTQKSGEPEIRELEGYTFMGVTEISDYDDNTYELLIPMGRNTSNYGRMLQAQMHGVKIYISTTGIYRRLTESVYADLQLKYNSFLDKSRDFKDVSIGELSATEDGEGIYGAVNVGQHVAYDGLVFPYHEIICRRIVNDNVAVTISITLDEYDYDVQTNTLLKEIEQAYQMDLSEFYYDISE